MMRELEKRRVIESHFNHGQSATEIWKHVKYLQISRATVGSTPKLPKRSGLH